MSRTAPEGFSDLTRLGDGSFGIVNLVQRESDGYLFALKVLEKKNGIQTAENEIEILNTLNSPFIINCYDVIKTDSSISLLLDPCLGGTLRVKIQECVHNGTSFDKEMILRIFTQMLLAVKEIHDHDIVHRDLSPTNFIFVKDDTDYIQLIDFGVSAKVKDGALKGTVGTPNYMSPELKKGKAHSQPTDMYSLGVILFELCELRLPKAGEVSSPTHPMFDDLISGLLSEDPSSRPSVDDCLAFPEINKLVEEFESVEKQMLTAHDWRPNEYVDNNDDDDVEFEVQEPDFSSNILQPGFESRIPVKKRHWREPSFEQIREAERVANEQHNNLVRILAERRAENQKFSQKIKEIDKQTKETWNKFQKNLAKHGSEFKHRLEEIKNQKRKVHVRPKTSGNSREEHATHNDVTTGDKLEKDRLQLEKMIGVERFSRIYRKLLEDPTLDSYQLEIGPSHHAMILKLLKFEREVYG